MRIMALLYHHRYGTSCFLVRCDTNPPKITNEVINALMQCDGAELERDDEWAEWCDPVDVSEIPTASSLCELST